MIIIFCWLEVPENLFIPCSLARSHTSAGGFEALCTTAGLLTHTSEVIYTIDHRISRNAGYLELNNKPVVLRAGQQETRVDSVGWLVGRQKLLLGEIMAVLQCSPSNEDSLGARKNVLTRGMTSFQGSKCTQMWYLGIAIVSCLSTVLWVIVV